MNILILLFCFLIGGLFGAFILNLIFIERYKQHTLALDELKKELDQHQAELNGFYGSLNAADFSCSMDDLVNHLINGLYTDGSHHKQWYLEKAIEMATGLPIEDNLDHDMQMYGNPEKGIAP